MITDSQDDHWHTVGLLLAGGAGRRLVKDKGWQTVGGTPIVVRVLQALSPVVNEVVIVGDCEAPPEWPLRQVADDTPGAGPLAAIMTGMKAAPADFHVVVAWDMPFISSDLLRHMLAACEGVDAVVPNVAGRDQPLCAAYAATCLRAIERTLAQGRRRADAFFPLIRVKRITEAELSAFGDPEHLFLNVNTPEDLALAAQLAGSLDKE